jgi:hypothetical protein
MAKAVSRSITPARRAKRPSKAPKRSPRRQPQIQPPRPGRFDVIADRFDFDHIDYSYSPNSKFGFSLHLGGDGSNWSGRTGRMEMHSEKAVDLALKIIGVAEECAAPFTDLQYKRLAKFALRRLFSKRRDAVMERYSARDITRAQAEQLSEEIREQHDDAVHALVAAKTSTHFQKVKPVTCEYIDKNDVSVWLKTATGDTVTYTLTSDSMMHLINLMVAAFHGNASQVYRDLRETPDAAT